MMENGTIKVTTESTAVMMKVIVMCCCRGWHNQRPVFSYSVTSFVHNEKLYRVSAANTEPTSEIVIRRRFCQAVLRMGLNTTSHRSAVKLVTVQADKKQLTYDR